MNTTKKAILDYLEDQRTINQDALKAYDTSVTPIIDDDPEVRRMREREAITLRDRVNELHRHIAVIKRMIPTS